MRKRSNGSATRDRSILRLYQTGNSCAEIGRRTGLTRERVRQIIRDAGAPAFYERLSVDRAALARRAIPLFRKRMTRVQVAERLGTTLSELHCCIIYARKVAGTPAASDWESSLVDAISEGRQARRERRRELLASSPAVRSIARSISGSGYPLRTLAAMSGVSYATVAELSQGAKYLPRPSTLKRLATVIPKLGRLEITA